ncbi:MAG: hypothetical protein B7Y84_15630 [Azorhizobium sp. 32-67-21]|nr:MAG: hypothetical protein B7Y84_15630 [Azorhizobium sp. 32-67-21]
MPPDPRAVLAEAASLLRAGQVDLAIDGLRRATAQFPAIPDAHRMLAMALLQAGRAKDAVQSARAGAQLTPGDPHALLLLGVALLGAGQAEKALTQFEKVTARAPGFAEAYFQAGNALSALGRFKEAVARYTVALERDPRAIEALANRAIAFARLRMTAEALADFDRLIVLQPWMPLHVINKGGLLMEAGDLAGARAAAEKAVELAPGHPDALFLLGQARLAANDLQGAAEALGGAVDAAPERADNRVMLAQVLRRLEAFPEAIAQCDAALALDPKLAGAYYERAEARRALDDAPGALADLDAALIAAPRHVQAAVARVYVLGDLGRVGEIRPAVERAARLGPTYPDAQFHLAMDDLALGHWAKGWQGYEARARIIPPTYLPLPFTRWDGKETPERLIVLGEQGFGDAIQFARLVPLLAGRGFPVQFLVRAPLIPLFRSLHPEVEIIEDLSGVDTSAPGLRWVPLGSLPLLLAHDPAQWPAVPYLAAEPDRVRQWSGVKLVAIQRNAGTEQMDEVPFRKALLRLDEDFDADGAFLDTAALLSHLDLVVTTDTSMAHLAGALGIPAIVALRAVPDWRWGREGEGSIFYPSLTLVRQARPGMWEGVFETIAEMVRRQMAAPSANEGE